MLQDYMPGIQCQQWCSCSTNLCCWLGDGLDEPRAKRQPHTLTKIVSVHIMPMNHVPAIQPCVQIECVGSLLDHICCLLLLLHMLTDGRHAGTAAARMQQSAGIKQQSSSSSMQAHSSLQVRPLVGRGVSTQQQLSSNPYTGCIVHQGGSGHL